MTITKPATQPAGSGQSEPPDQNTQPEGNPAQSPAQQGGNQEFVTRADLEAARQELFRQVQSLTGKSEARVQKELQRLHAAGIQATPDQIQKLMEQEPSEPSQPQGQPAAAQPAQVEQPAQAAFEPKHFIQASKWLEEDGETNPDPTTMKGYLLMAQAGIRLLDTDPEAKDIPEGLSEEQWLMAVAKGLQAKAQRLQKAGNPATMPNLTKGAASSQPAHATMSGRETLNLAFSDFGE